jgi:hypothetical protein
MILTSLLQLFCALQEAMISWKRDWVHQSALGTSKCTTCTQHFWVADGPVPTRDARNEQSTRYLPAQECAVPYLIYTGVWKNIFLQTCIVSMWLPRLLLNPKVHYRANKSPLLVTSLSQINHVHILIRHLFKIQGPFEKFLDSPYYSESERVWTNSPQGFNLWDMATLFESYLDLNISCRIILRTCSENLVT